MGNTWNATQYNNIANMSIGALELDLVPMSAFTLNLSPDVPQGTTVETRIVPVASAPTDLVDDESGTYAAVVDDVTTEQVLVTLDPHPVNGFYLTDTDAQRIASGVWSGIAEKLVKTHIRSIASAILDSLFALVTNAKFGAAGVISSAANFSFEDVVDLRTAATNAGWPRNEGTLELNPAFYGALVKDAAISDKSASQADALNTGTLPNLSGFDIICAPTLPTNSENLAGFACLDSAMTVAMRGVDSQARNKFEHYQIMETPVMGAVVTYSAVYTEQTTRRLEHIFEALYGVKEADNEALIRITTA